MTIGLCTDSASQLPTDLAARLGVEVVPVTVRIGDEEYLEGVDLDADRFYELFHDGERPTVTTTQPSSGQYALAYDELLSRGCTEIVSVHAMSTVSGSMNAARLAAHQMGVPVRLVDSGATGFAVSCAVWAAAEAVAAGGSIDDAASAAERVGPTVGNVFVMGALDLLEDRSGGSRCAVPVLGLRDGQVHVLDRVHSFEAAVEAMVAYTTGWGHALRVGIGAGDRDVAPFTAALAEAIGASGNVDQVEDFRIGPSAGSHTGPGTAACFMFPSAT